jgi:hypothetical protein
LSASRSQLNARTKKEEGRGAKGQEPRVAAERQAAQAEPSLEVRIKRRELKSKHWQKESTDNIQGTRTKGHKGQEPRGKSQGARAEMSQGKKSILREPKEYQNISKAHELGAFGFSHVPKDKGCLFICSSLWV